jgi:hypothetical protein
MTNIFKDPEKHDRKKRLFKIGVEALQKEGWSVEREKGLGKSSVRRVTKNGESKLVSIRTTQDRWLAFPPKPNGKGWVTLDEVDVVLAVSFSPASRQEVWVHWVPAKEMRGRFDLAYKARKEAERVLPTGRGIWIPLYGREDDNDNVSYVGGGAGLDHPPIAKVPLNGAGAQHPPTERDNPSGDDDGHLTIADAKRRLALSLGVPESSIKITVEA